MLDGLFLRKCVDAPEVVSKVWTWGLLIGVAWVDGGLAADPTTLRELPHATRNDAAQAITSIHWQRVPLRQSITRLADVFGATVFVDRRVDPGQRVSLDVETSSAEEVLKRLAAPRDLDIPRLEGLLYLGPRDAVERLRPLAVRRAEDVERLPLPLRATLKSKQPARWARLTEPRKLVVKLVEQRGWHVENAQTIPHDLWPAGYLPELSLPDQLSVLLLGFDLTFEMRSRERSIQIVPLNDALLDALAEDAKHQAAGDRVALRSPGTLKAPERRQVYTLRVSEQPVRAVLQEFSRRLKWPIEFDEAAIRAAGRSLETRVSFAVEQVEQNELLEALLRPAGLAFVRDDERITIVPRD